MRPLQTIAPDSDPEMQRLLEESRSRQAAGLVGRERRVEAAAALALLFVAVPMAVLIPFERALDVPLAAALVVSYALAARVEFHTGSGWTVPTQLVLVPMLFLLPAPAVPLFVALALLLGKLPEYATGAVHADRAVLGISDAWYTVGPALVLAATGATTPDWADWPVYLAALGAQLGFDLVSSIIRGRLGLGLRVRGHLDELGSVYLVDVLLSPIGLVAAFAAADEAWAFLLVMPLVALIAVFAREREARIENALVLGRAYQGTAHLMAELLTTSHEYTGNHSRSVVILAHQVGERMGLDEMALREVEFGALLHDIGKWAIPNSIINKPGLLTEEEMALMRTHTVEGEEMLGRIGGVLADVGQVVRSHHEFFDGSGYPDGLSGEDIPIASRIISACDAFNAMITDRSYRSAMTITEAIAELRDCAGRQFDPRVVEALVAIVVTWDRGTPVDDVREPIVEAAA